MDRIFIAHLDNLVRRGAREERASRDPALREADGFAAIALAMARLKMRGAGQDGRARRERD